MSDDRGALLAEAQYLRVRRRELQDELARNAKDLNVPAVTDENAPAIVGDIADALRASGNAALAGTYASAFDRVATAAPQLEMDITAGRVDERGRTALNEAEEQFERIAAEVGAWLEKLTDQAGA